MVIATNPIFPREVIYERLRWAGVERMPFDLVTSYENSRYTKPNPLYFKAILDTIDAAPEHALMVGDEHWDMAAGSIGIKTFFVKSRASNLTEHTPPPTYRGKLSDIPDLLTGRGKNV
ncbi:MAG: HAD family hydrolase [Firmicutes bacterium]|nr:HAD family hydrolase [Bacillota bacterium]